jgi:small conductance mechanosensitive channel
MCTFLQRVFFVLVFGILAVPAAAADAKPDTGAPTAADLEQLVGTLKDDAKREAFLRDLQTLVDAQKKTDAKQKQPIGTRMLETLSDKVENTGEELAKFAAALIDLPNVFNWLQKSISNPDTRSKWLVMLAKLAAILIAGLLVEWVANRFLRRPRKALESQSADGWWLNLIFALLRMFLEVTAIIAFAAAAYGVMTIVAPSREGKVVAIALINASVLCRAIAAITRMVLAPRIGTMRLLPIGDETANYSFLWIRRLTNWTVYGFFVIQAGLPLGLPAAAQDALMKLLGLVIALLLIMLLLQNRQHIAAAIAGEAGRPLGTIRRRFAEVWHFFGIGFIVASYAVWALEIPGGFEYLLRATALSLVVLAIARGLTLLEKPLTRRAFALTDEQKTRFPGLEARANRYLPVLRRTIRTVIYVAAALAVLDVWGLDLFKWFSGPVGSRLLGRIITIATIIVVTLVVWEIISAAIERYLNSTDPDGNIVTRSQRVRTLLPLLRNLVLIVLMIMAGLMVLSELGIEIGPLIAGAGILGLAVGFGAQTIVKDFITGFFILMEDTVAVGDLVELSGHTGRVEAMSVRSIQLRDFQGQVHRIPFSAVTTTINKSKDFSYAQFDIGVAYSEDIDRCMGIMREVGAEMRADPEYAPLIDADFDVQGVQSLGDSAIIIRARVQVQPGKQIVIQRVYNRLIKNRFDQEGIEIPFPHRTLYFGVDSHGNAPPARIAMQDGPAKADQPAAARPETREIPTTEKKPGSTSSDDM